MKKEDKPFNTETSVTPLPRNWPELAMSEMVCQLASRARELEKQLAEARKLAEKYHDMAERAYAELVWAGVWGLPWRPFRS